MQSNNEINSLPSRTSKIKPFFPHKTKWRCSTPSDITFINKYKPKMLKDLQITQIDDSKTGPQSLRQLRKAFVDAKMITSLSIQKNDVYRTYQTTKKLGYLLTISNRIQKLSLSYNNRKRSRLLDEITLRNLKRLKKWKNLSSLEIHSICPEKMQDRILSRLSSQLRFHKQLKALRLDVVSDADYTVQGPPDYDPNASLLKFKYPQCLSSLKVTFNPTTITQEHLLPGFISNLQRCGLKSLHLNSPSWPSKNSISLVSGTWAPLFANPSLESITLSRCFSDKNMYCFLDGFSHLKNLTALDLDLFTQLPGKEFKIFITTLYNHLASLSNFKSLTLRISWRSTTPHSEFEPIYLLQNLRQLENLTISCPNGIALEKPHQQSLASLKKLDLQFKTEKVSFEGMASLLHSLEKLPVLSLQFPYASLSNKSMQILFASIAHLPLTNLSLRPGEPKASILTSLWGEKPKLTPLFSALCGFNLLTHLDLNLKAFKLSTAEAKHFSLALKKVKNLRGLSIVLPEFDAENNHEGLRSFFESLKEIPKLSSLKMSFVRGKMGYEAIRALAENLQGGRSLKVLDIDFDHIDGRISETICCILTGLRDLHLLQELRLISISTRLWTEKSNFELFEGLATLKYLESLVVNRVPFLEGLAKEMIEKQAFKRLTYCVINSRRI